MKKIPQDIPEIVQNVMKKSPEEVLKIADTFPDNKRDIQKNFV